MRGVERRDDERSRDEPSATPPPSRQASPRRVADRRVLVLQAAALPRSQGGATRHVELFGRLRGWAYLIVAGNRSNYTRQTYVHRSDDFVTVPVPGYASNGIGRILNWLAYAVGAFGVGIRQRKISVVFGSSPHLMAPIAGWLLARIRRVPFVLEVRDLWPRSMVELGYLREGSLVHRILVRVEGFLYRAADKIVVVVDGWEDHFASFGIPADKLVVVSNGADPDDFTPSVTREKARAQLGVDGFVLIYAGAHGPTNGLDTILDAAKELPDCTFLLVGDGLEKSRLTGRADNEGIGNVRFLDPVPKEGLGDVFVACDVGLHTLTQADLFKEAISPNKLWDYMAAGLPAITNVGGPFERLIVELDCGAAGSPEEGEAPGHALADAIRELQRRTPDELVAMGQRGRAYVEEHVSRTAMAERLQGALDQVVRR